MKFIQIVSTVFAVISLSSIAFADTLYKCKEPGRFGNIVWQDRPCDAGYEVESRDMRDYSSEYRSRKSHGALTNEQARQLIRLRKIKVGMSKKDVIRSWGKPNRTSVTLESDGKSEFMFYSQYKGSPVVSINERNVVARIDYYKSKPVPPKPEKRLGTVNANGFGQYGKQ